MNEVTRVARNSPAYCPCGIVVRVNPVVLRNCHVAIGVHCLDVRNVVLPNPCDVAAPDGTGAAISCHAADLSRQEKPPALLAGGHISQRETQMRGHGRPNQALEPTPKPVALLFFISYLRSLVLRGVAELEFVR